jgi:uncharacterized protein YegJ (DUF2314 family)
MFRKLILSFCLIAFGCTSAPSTSAISSTDPELDAAIQEARNTLDVFIQKLATPDSDRTFAAVKVRFVTPDGSSQDIWVDGVTYEDGSFSGNFGDDLPSLKLSMGERIHVNREEIVDWMLVEDGKLVGGYTIRLAYQRMSPEEKERFLEAANYSIED